jgi:hypothetical protein
MPLSWRELLHGRACMCIYTWWAASFQHAHPLQVVRAAPCHGTPILAGDRVPSTVGSPRWMLSTVSSPLDGVWDQLGR